MFEVQLWQVILLFIAVVGFLVSAIIGHESRITKVETSNAYIVKTLDELKETAKDTNELMRKHIEKDC